ncbi:helix-turn-helix domain-containing protein [Vibrio phage vB_VruC_PG21]|uniref:Helix-turn-helix domain-containing protein n=1 Tax=Vibrio phage vB_VruC_PG21 TaxID=2928757 RepID=A0AAE9GSG1_9VIRU|nr:helix-turn-helix domain-containing protein [Vibrio sp. CK2-1]MCF7355066.1 helix-turn-helix domain-containing protein [Vibrio sp. CK2-1]UOL48297.1 helix-turn-helix domain-containing protein [Vibrio phage vB_VruC_PG21]
MIKTVKLLDMLRLEKQLDSDRQVAKFLGVSQASVQRWRNGGTMTDDQACIVADMLGLDVDLVLLAIIAERSKNNRAIEALHKLETNQRSQKIA